MADVLLYRDAYKSPTYRMGAARLAQAGRLLEGSPSGSLLDVGCGRGEVVTLAAELGYSPAHGIEIVPELCHESVSLGALPELPVLDGEFGTVVCLDVLEHVAERLLVACIRELARVCLSRLVVTVSNTHDPYHLTIMSYHAWQLLLTHALPGWVVTRLSALDTDINTPFEARPK